MKKKKELGVIITGIPEKWIGPAEMRDLEKMGISYYSKGGYCHIVLADPKLAGKLLKKKVGIKRKSG